MKAKVRNDIEFKPITVEVTIESQEELDGIKKMAQELVPSEISQSKHSKAQYTYTDKYTVVCLVEAVGNALDREIPLAYCSM